MDTRVGGAFAAVLRHDFLPAGQHRYAGLDRPLPIGYGVTNSQPSTVRDMLELVAAAPGDRVLDVGSGSGWTSALLAHLVGPTGVVVAVERIRALVDASRASLASYPALCERVTVHAAEPGVLGWPADAPYDRILVSAATNHLPAGLVAQLRCGGVLVVPVDGVMLRVTATSGGPVVERHGRYVFVPLIED